MRSIVRWQVATPSAGEFAVVHAHVACCTPETSRVLRINGTSIKEERERENRRVPGESSVWHALPQPLAEHRERSCAHQCTAVNGTDFPDCTDLICKSTTERDTDHKYSHINEDLRTTCGAV